MKLLDSLSWIFQIEGEFYNPAKATADNLVFFKYDLLNVWN